MANENIRINLEAVTEQIEQSFQMLHNALYTRQNQLLSQLNDIAVYNENCDTFDDSEADPDIQESKCNPLKYFGFKMDDVLKEIRDFGTISMTSVDTNFTTIADRNRLNRFPINEDIKISMILKNCDGELVSDKGLLDPRVHIELKTVGLPQCDVLETEVPHLIDLNIKLPQLGEYELSVKLCESSILGSPFTLIGSPSDGFMEFDESMEPIKLDYLYKIGTRGIKPSDFGNPQSIIVNNDRILVTDSGNSCIQIFNENGEYLTCFGPKEKKSGKLLRPVDIAQTTNGHYLVTDFELGLVLVYDLLGNYVSCFGQKFLVGPKGICVDRSGQIIVADNKDSSLVFFRGTGKFMKKVKDKPRSERKLAGPHFLVVIACGDILVTDFYNHCVKVFDRNGIYRNDFGKQGDSWGEFNYPTGICCSEQDDIIVSDWGNSRIVIFNNRFMCTTIIKSKDEPLCGPQGITLNRDNSQILIVDSGNHCFKAFEYQKRIN